MKAFLKKYRFFLIAFAIFSAITLTLFYRALDPGKSLPIYHPAMVNPELVDSTMQHVSNYHKVADFAFVNQNGVAVTQKDYEGKVYVADFFFTTCGTICPIMTSNMTVIQDAIKGNPDVKLLSHTVMPEVDDVPKLKQYAIDHKVIDDKWNLVTGDKREIYKMARKSYLAVKMGKPSELYDMVHTENFVLVDQQRQVRGFYDGTNPEDIQRLIADINWLTEKKK
jgi:protein SCO1/2